MDAEVQKILEQIQASPFRVVVISTGGGAKGVSWLGELAGSSRTLLEANVPYGQAALAHEVGYSPKKFVSPPLAEALAHQAYERARTLAPHHSFLLGVGSTASLATLHPKRGEHRVVVAVRDSQKMTTYDVLLSKGLRDRAGEDTVASLLLIRALARAAGIGESVKLGLENGERMDAVENPCASALTRLIEGEIKALLVEPDGRWLTRHPQVEALLPGAFHPCHKGHRGLAQAAGEILRGNVLFELSIRNVDKPPLREPEIRQRLEQFAWRANIILTRAATFRDKAELFPGCTFVVGSDTAERVVSERYYGNRQAMRSALIRIRDLGCRFLVAARFHQGSLRTLESLNIPPAFRPLFAAIPEAVFREDLSSSMLRNQPANP